MKLNHWLVLNNVSHTYFADVIGVHAATVGKYLDGVIPGKIIMRRIYLATGGQVAQNDFYDLSLDNLTKEEQQYVNTTYRKWN